jgi:hypothetical protein
VVTAGRKQGVQPRMQFCVREPKENHATAEVVEVRDDDCTVEFQDFMFKGAKSVEPEAGWRLSTRSWVYEPSEPKK